MTDLSPNAGPGQDPSSPQPSRPTSLTQIYAVLAHAKLAMGLLIIILACCIMGSFLQNPKNPQDSIFFSLWFNGILVLLIVNVSFCFFGRVWRQKINIISLGMILFHLSFVSLFAGIVYNSLFYFRGVIRLTEGEHLPNYLPSSYDTYEHGRFFNFNWLKGDTTISKITHNYSVDGINKRWAYDISTGTGRSFKQGTIYVTKSLDSNGLTYYNDKEGYSILAVLYDKHGNELYGGFLPLQSFKRKDDTYFYTTGDKLGPAGFPFPQETNPLFNLQVNFRPDEKKEKEGMVSVLAFKHKGNDTQDVIKIAEGQGAIGEKLQAGDYYLSIKEVRYWAAMTVRYEPGQIIALSSLWIGLAGLVISALGRLRRSKRSELFGSVG